MQTPSATLGIDIGGTSVKAVAFRAASIVGKGQSGPYSRPDTAQLRAAIATAAEQAFADADATPPACRAIGLCVPGPLDAHKQHVTASVNLPAIVGLNLDDLLHAARLPPAPRATLTDTNAAALDLYHARTLSGRLLVIAIGTGVGAAVRDGPGPDDILRADGDSPGHLGQCDVSCDPAPPLGPDGGRGSLEAYLGRPALLRQYGHTILHDPAPLDVTDPPLRALVRAIRLCHALYRPHHICLAGGLGRRLGRLVPALRSAVADELTRIARPDWTLTAADHDFHAAAGAARYAQQKNQPQMNTGEHG